MTARRVLVGTAASGLAAFVGLLAVRALPLGADLPSAVLLVGLVLLAAVPIALGRWPLALGAFLVWLVVEDLVRKMAGNDLRVFFAKDLIFLVVLGGLLLDERVRGAWRAATGQTRFALYCLIGWAVLMSIPVVGEDWRLPLLGLRLDFLYLPLVAAGYLLAREPGRLRRWVTGIAVLGAAAAAVGIVQAVQGPGFLAPEQETPGLGLLVTVRGLPGAEAVYRPSGTFVSSGRFASMALLALAIALAAILVRRGRGKAVGIVSVLLAGGGVWVSGGRGAFVVGLVLVATAAVAPAFAERRPRLGGALTVAGAAVAGVMVVAAFLPNLFASRSNWYRSTLDPRSAEAEWTARWASHAEGTARGIAVGGLIGTGTGRESLGKQYISGDVDRSPSGLYEVEAGFGAIAVEWGVLGLGFWLIWTIAWVRRQWRSVRAARDGPMAAVGLVLFSWVVLLLFVQFFGGLANFQNYVVNAYFWLLSGMIFALPEAAARLRERGDIGPEGSA